MLDRIFGKEFLCVNLMKPDVFISKFVFKCLTLVLTRCPVVHIWIDHMGRVQLLDCFVCSGISLPQQINTFILCIFLILETQPHNSCLNSFPEISGTSVSEVAALPAPFFLGQSPQSPVLTQVLSPKIARRAELDKAGGGKLRTGMPSHGMYTRSSHGWCPCRKKRSSTPEARFTRSSCTPLDSAPRVSPLCPETCVSFVCSSRPADATL